MQNEVCQSQETKQDYIPEASGQNLYTITIRYIYIYMNYCKVALVFKYKFICTLLFHSRAEEKWGVHVQNDGCKKHILGYIILRFA